MMLQMIITCHADLTGLMFNPLQGLIKKPIRSSINIFIWHIRLIMQILFKHQTVIVTGAAHGFGRAIAIGFSHRAASVWACDILGDELEETRRLCQMRGGKCEVRTVDVTDRDAVRAFVNEALAREGRIDVMVNNAGGVLGQTGRPIEQVTPEQWQGIFDVNLHAAFWFAQAVAPAMKAARNGRIVNISSGAGLSISLTGIQAYASSKAAQIGLTRQLAHELGPWNIAVNAIAPGFVRSNPNSERQWQAMGEAGQREVIDSIALRRLGTPEDVAHSVMFLASEYASWITGQVLPVDGGK
jgi:3-oxoacyl-[acyl-carrier protein] reductase